MRRDKAPTTIFDTENSPVCKLCGLLCLVPHKRKEFTTKSLETTVYFHDAHAEDCWEQEKKKQKEMKDA